MSRYRLRITIECYDADGWHLCHDGGGESDAVVTVVKILEATASSIEGGTIALDEGRPAPTTERPYQLALPSRAQGKQQACVPFA
jgi:hypothetical protein